MTEKASYGLHGFEVVENRPVADQIYRLVMQVGELAGQIEPGQFLNVRVPGDHSHLLRVPLSFSEASADDGTIEIVYAVVGEGTRRLSGMAAGDRSDVVGPLGHGWFLPPTNGRALLISGGVGLPPVVACAGMLAENGIPMDAIVGAQTASRLWEGGIERLEALGCKVHVATDDGTEGFKGFTTDKMAELLETQTYASAFTCGPNPMMSGIARLSAQHGIFLETSLERMMTCGFGACNTCNVALAKGGYASCCKDGPVFDASEVAW